MSQLAEHGGGGGGPAPLRNASPGWVPSTPAGSAGTSDPTRFRLSNRAWNLAVVVLAVVAALPLLRPGMLYADGLRGDPVRAAAHAHTVALQLLDGHWPRLALPWGAPAPTPLSRWFATWIDVVWGAPLYAVLPAWTAWKTQQALSIVVNVVGVAVLTAGIGARGPGRLFAAGLAATWPLGWKELLVGRFQAASPGFAALAIGAILLARAHAGGARWGWVLLSALATVVAVGSYAPWLAFVALIVAAMRKAEAGGTHVAPAPLRATRPDRASAALVAIPAALAILVGASVLAGRAAKGVDIAACPAPGGAVPMAALAAITLWGHEGAWPTWIPAGAWCAALLAWSERHGRVAVILGGVFAVLAAGPCSGLAPLDTLLGALSPLTSLLNDHGRFATVATLALALGGARAVDVAWSRTPRMAALVGGLGLAHALASTLTAVASAHAYTMLRTPAAALWLASQRSGIAAELPFDTSGQYLSVMAEPRRPRLNPLAVTDAFHPDSSRTPTPLTTLARAGRLEQVVLPEADALRAAGLTALVYDAARCVSAVHPDDAGATSSCTDALPRALRTAYGPGVTLQDGSLAWAF